ncbi:MAG TPA: PDZ domain-containing protein [Pirellulaceae bacterium]|nr:PDZ domain-containing protein [Pirellulaceae bacterium]
MSATLMLRRLAPIAAGLLAASLACAQEAPPPPGGNPASSAAKPRDPPSAETIARWIVELDSDVFDNRENATLKLVEAGAPAVEPIKKVLQTSGSLEVTTRALHALRELALSVDLEVQEAARAALEELAREPTSIGRRSEAAIAWLNDQRSTQTIEALEKLGAIVNKTEDLAELGVAEDIDGIQIDDSWRGTERDFRRLKWLRDVDKLVLVGEKIDDTIMPHVAAMSGLKQLHLYRTKISEQGLAALTSLESLSEMGIYYSPVGDGVIDSLKKMKGLSGVKLYGTKISLSKEELAAALDLDRLDYRRGAFLGVSCQTLGQQCELATVHPDSPAEKAGLRAGDTIVTFAGKNVADFDSLTDVIAKYGVDDVVEVVYIRLTIDENGNHSREQSLTCKVTLGEWAVDLVQRQPIRP